MKMHCAHGAYVHDYKRYLNTSKYMSVRGMELMQPIGFEDIYYTKKIFFRESIFIFNNHNSSNFCLFYILYQYLILYAIFQVQINYNFLHTVDVQGAYRNRFFYII